MIQRTIFMILTVGLLLRASATERLIVVNEGLWQTDNGRLTYLEDGKVVSNQWFRDVNGSKLGDTPNDIIQINDSLIAISVNWSNIVQFITPKGKAVAATEDIPNNRKLCTDGSYVYATSYGHECKVNGMFEKFEKGFVAKIDLRTFKVVAAVEVGYEPEGIAIYNGHLFVANTGGYAFQESHDYETTVTIIDASTMKIARTVDTGQINLYGKMSQSGQYLCINSPGDYYGAAAASLIFDCRAALNGRPDSECYQLLELAATYNCTDTEGYFYAIGSRFSYYTNDYQFNYARLNPAEIMETGGAEGIYYDFPGTVLSELKEITMPYGIYVNPYSGYIYATDAGSFATGGHLYQWDNEGRLLGIYDVYINPAHFLAVALEGFIPNGNIYDNNDDETGNDGDDEIGDTSGNGTDNTTDNPSDSENDADSDAGNDDFESIMDALSGCPCDEYVLYNLQGIRVSTPREGEIYICNGEKFIYRYK